MKAIPNLKPFDCIKRAWINFITHLKKKRHILCTRIGEDWEGAIEVRSQLFTVERSL